jgi:uncharacterized membrane protein
MKKSLLIFTLLIIAVVTQYACKHDLPPVLVPAPTQEEIDKAAPTVCFESSVLPVIQSNCARSGCHSVITHSGGFKLNNYANIISLGIVSGKASNSPLYQSLLATSSNKMPKAGYPTLSTEQIVLIRQWINQGIENTINCAATCDTTKFKYAADIKPILNTYCTGCHTGPTAQGGIEFATYTLLKDQIDNNVDAFYGSIIHEPGYSYMPKYADKMKTCEITKIKKWIDAGALNN